MKRSALKFWYYHCICKLHWTYIFIHYSFRIFKQNFCLGVNMIQILTGTPTQLPSYPATLYLPSIWESTWSRSWQALLPYTCLVSGRQHDPDHDRHSYPLLAWFLGVNMIQIMTGTPTLYTCLVSGSQHDPDHDRHSYPILAWFLGVNMIQIRTGTPTLYACLYTTQITYIHSMFNGSNSPRVHEQLISGCPNSSGPNSSEHNESWSAPRHLVYWL